MKKLTIILILFLLLLLSACSLSEGNIQDKITSPENKTIPIQGKWVIEEKLASSEEEEGEVNNFVHEDRDTYVGKEVLFNKDALVVADDFTISPTFSLKM